MLTWFTYRDAGLVILPAYYAASLNTDHEQIVQYYVDICNASPVCHEICISHRALKLTIVDSPVSIQFPCKLGRSGHVISHNRSSHSTNLELVWR
jgi:hypothetical protein